jgi:hypothetical protein
MRSFTGEVEEVKRAESIPGRGDHRFVLEKKKTRRQPPPRDGAPREARYFQDPVREGANRDARQNMTFPTIRRGKVWSRGERPPHPHTPRGKSRG